MFRGRLIQPFDRQLQNSLGIGHFGRVGRRGGSGRSNFLDRGSQSRPFMSVFRSSAFHFSKSAFGTVSIRHWFKTAKKSTRSVACDFPPRATASRRDGKYIGSTNDLPVLSPRLFPEIGVSDPSSKQRSVRNPFERRWRKLDSKPLQKSLAAVAQDELFSCRARSR